MILKPDPIIACLGFLHSVQKERGLAALFLCSRGKQGSEELKTQFAATGEAAAKLQESLSAIGFKREALFLSVQALPSLRLNITAQHVWALDVIDQYSKALTLPAISLINDLIIRNPRNKPGRVSALLYLLNWQERLAHEREMVTQLAGREWMHDDAFVSRLKNTIRERQAYERLFWGMADETQRKACSTLKQTMEEGRAAAKKAPNPQDKFSFFNIRIDALYEAACKLSLLLEDESAASEGIIHAGQPLEAEVEAQFDTIRTLPVFRGLSTEVLQELLRSARMVQHEKNSVFITQGEIPARFHIVMDGWVKTYKSNEEGDESILQILGRREAVLDSYVLQPVPSPLNVKSITKVKLLSIPCSQMRDYIVQYRDMALNMLSASARRSQKLIAHFERLTLHTATERVGSFLLNLNLETGIGGPPLELPFDKSLIAAWLGIKPETFSRILQELRLSGFVIDRNRIILPEPFALCDYCDADTMRKCDLAGTASCPRAGATEEMTAGKAG